MNWQNNLKKWIDKTILKNESDILIDKSDIFTESDKLMDKSDKKWQKWYKE